jgi:hypothetical protein
MLLSDVFWIEQGNVSGLIFPDQQPIVNRFFALSSVDISRMKPIPAFIPVQSVLRGPAGRREKIRQ